MRHYILFLISLFLFQAAIAQKSSWYKGNLHTHTYWSDGDDYPEMVLDWYKTHNYDFITLSDHNIFAEGDKWIDTSDYKSGKEAYAKYLARFGEKWVESRKKDGTLEVRLKTFAEFEPELSAEGDFLIIPSEEITDGFNGKPVHINATNIDHVIKPQGGTSMVEVIQRNIDAVLQQREETGQPMFPHINHPNFGWAMTPMDLVAVTGERFFEVYNGHPHVRNYGDETHPGTEEMWDIVLTSYLQTGKPPIYGLATDDSHHYHQFSTTLSNSGRGWVMVKATELTAEALIEAMEQGDFYSSSGVEIRKIKTSGKKLKISIKAEPGITYKTQFIGTVGEDIGKVLKEVDGPAASYTYAGDELYVRAKIQSTKVKENPYVEGEFEAAWTQPVVR